MIQPRTFTLLALALAAALGLLPRSAAAQDAAPPAPAEPPAEAPALDGDARPVLNVYGTQVRAVVVAVPPPVAADDAPDAAWQRAYDARVRRALSFHGALAPLDRAAELPDATPVKTFDPKSWRAAGAEILLRTRVELDGETTVLEAFLYDVAEREAIWTQRYRMKSGSATLLGDAVAGGVVTALLGVPSPFGTSIYFQYRAPDQRWRELYATDWTGEPLEARSTGQRLILNPAGVPGANQVVAVGYRQRVPALYLFDFGMGNERELLRSEGNLHGPAVLPGGRQAVVAWERGRNTDLYLVDLQTGETERLTTSTAADLSPTVSPDGRTVAFVSDRRGNPYLYALDLETRQTRELVLEGLYLGEPAWSPDGKRIVFVRRDRGTGFALFLLDVESGRTSRVSDYGGDSLESPSWAPDNRTIVYSQLRGNSYDLWKVDRLLKESRPLTNFPGDARMPDWQAPLK